MYRWTDPIEPDGAARRPEPSPAEGPAWLADRPEPRSAYLFGDEPEQPGPNWAEAPTGERQAADWPAADEPTTAWRPVTERPAEKVGRHRQKRRFPRPLLVGGAAAAATLVVSLGVAAAVLPGGDQRTESTSAEEPVAAAPVVPGSTGDDPVDALAAPPSPASPTAAPTSARPSPTRTATPKPSRTTAPSRRLERSAAPSATTASSAAAPSGISAELRQVVDLVNKERARADCKALAVDDKLMLAAQRHSKDQADHKTMSHDGSDGSDPGDRLDRVGYAWRAYGENVAWNQQTPAAVMDAWMKSPGHRANILNCSFTEIGVGVARSNGPYWTQDFGTPR
ncbi:Uncharacterized conserved protein YkwD, contains CAP (CSP/antigen 5/PR1) domain [Micromonospora viridifaciens]|uniref:Uncharacterized conserved protein YkwD, contains CAP (CSP/antigen 5/PR1) domain n=1 Tax=Micromonospora viridifaciens TaxID=1881 RepID=A0A1C4ZHQ3_MICVI|nr:CAP domain-containing protein [Micromonospora viridifaciens]SCF32557.1 Uncharacterized conserved protein YkwD, contains CAP (CSP/antigen 5/PR1) domain [Micromonospora viridifaciens]